jgi:protein-L-isoaspartate(D-aspartate) O-methyltransferase
MSDAESALLSAHAPDRIRLVMKLRLGGITDTKVLSAMESVPRELFVPEAFQDKAYEDTALPIEHGQTISQPRIVALMTSALALNDRLRVLEIGTGSGYQAAILARLCRMVYTVERHRPLMDAAKACFSKLKCHNILAKVGDGSQGWKSAAPFDRILVTAAAAVTPEALLDQLGTGGVMVIPVGCGQEQTLLRIERTADGFEQKQLAGVRFVPLIANATD